MSDIDSTPPNELRTPSVWRAISRLADRQHRLVTTRQLRSLGISPATINAYVRRGHLHHIHRGVYAVGTPTLTRRGRYMAAVLACGPGAALSHQSAAGLHEVREDTGWVIHVTVPRKLKSRRGIRVHHSRDLAPADITEKDGIPVTSVARTLVDLGGEISRDGQEQAVARAMRMGLIDHMPSAPGRRAVIRAPRFTRSGYERRLLNAIRAAGLPEPLTNHQLAGWELDMYWPDQRLALEIDPWSTHHDPVSHENDRAKSADLYELGIHVHRVTDRQIDRSLSAVVARIGRLLASR